MGIRTSKSSMPIAAIVLLGVFFQSCGAGDFRLSHRWYNSAEIYWQREAPWGLMRPHLYDAGSVLSCDSVLRPRHAELEDMMFLRYVSDRISGAEYEMRECGSAGDAVIVLLLHHRGGTDTLTTNARPEFGLQFNGVTVWDSVLVRRMIDIVSNIDTHWKNSRDSLCYGGRYNALPVSRMLRPSQPNTRHIERTSGVMPIQDYDTMTVYYMNSPEWNKEYVSPVSTDWYFQQQDRLGIYASSFVITGTDTLSYIIRRLQAAEMTVSDSKNYHLPNIIILMRDSKDGLADTLSARGNYRSSLQFNSSEFHDSGLDAFLTEMVLRRSPEWRSVLEYAPEFYREKYIPEEYRMRE